MLDHTEFAFQDMLKEQQSMLGKCLKIDLHCHDKNSDIPDELWGRILRVPESWLETEQLFDQLKSEQVDGYTVTNHNNARSCWNLLEKGHDILSGAEFTCCFPEYDFHFHVLAYGFTPDQEQRLNQLRADIYRFVRFAGENDLPLILAHPLFFRPFPHGREVLDKFLLLFDKFEALNGQRDYWQNLLTAKWILNFDEDKLDSLQRRYGIRACDFLKNPLDKKLTGGSDDHLGIFAGSCGTLVGIDELGHSRTEQILAGLRANRVAPYGNRLDSVKLNVALLDYFLQLAIHFKDPGLLRMFLHAGDMKNKAACWLLCNSLMELKRHRFSERFFKTFHHALGGKAPMMGAKYLIGPEYRPIFNELERIAQTKQKHPNNYIYQLEQSISCMSRHLGTILFDRLRHNQLNTVEWNHYLELPGHIRTLFKRSYQDKGITLGELLDSLSFPLLGATMLWASALSANRLLYGNRQFLKEAFDDLLPTAEKKMICMDSELLILAQQYNVDVIVEGVDENIWLGEIEIGENCRIKFPDIMMILKKMSQNNYCSVACSLETSLAALYLKESFCIPCYLWISERFEEHLSKINDIRRIIRAFLQRFDGIYTSSTHIASWLSSREMKLNPEMITLYSIQATEEQRGA